MYPIARFLQQASKIVHGEMEYCLTAEYKTIAKEGKSGNLMMEAFVTTVHEKARLNIEHTDNRRRNDGRLPFILTIFGRARLWPYPTWSTEGQGLRPISP